MGGVFLLLLLQQRSKHPREMFMTPKASTSNLVYPHGIIFERANALLGEAVGQACCNKRNRSQSSNVFSRASRRRAPAYLRQPEPRMRLAVRGVPKGALCTHFA